MEVFLVCENIDLGYHVRQIYASSITAETECARLNKVFFEEKVAALVAHCGYTLEHAERYAETNQPFFVEAREVI